MCSAHYDEESHRCIVAERLQAFKRRVTTLQLPLLVLFEQRRSDQAHDRGLVGKIPTRRCDLMPAFKRSRGLVECIWSRCAAGRVMCASTSASASPMSAPIVGKRSRT